MDTSIVPSPPSAITEQGHVVTGPLTQADYEGMKRETKCWRDTLLLMTFRNTGFRPKEIAALEARHIDRQGPAYLVWVHRAKKRKADLPDEGVYLNPMLGQALIAWVQGQALKPSDKVFGLSTRQMQRIVNEAGFRAIGRVVVPKEFRRMYVRTVAKIAPEVIGFGPQHFHAASKMVGHVKTQTTQEWYWELTVDERRAIQERVQV